MEDIIVLTLITGNDVICKATESNGAFAVKKPLLIMQVPDEKTQSVRLGFMPYSHVCDPDSIIILKNAIASIGEPIEEIKRQYQEATGDIIVPSSKIQLA